MTCYSGVLLLGPSAATGEQEMRPGESCCVARSHIRMWLCCCCQQEHIFTGGGGGGKETGSKEQCTGWNSEHCSMTKVFTVFKAN